MKRSPRPRKPISLPESMLQQLNTYALATSAAGVSLLAIATPSAARIVYTRAHKEIAPNHTVGLDLNHDGKIDFNIHDSFTCTSFCEYIVGSLTLEPTRTANEGIGQVGRSYQFASALKRGVRVGGKSPFVQGNAVMAFGGYDAGTNSVGWCGGPWSNAQNRYLGLKFTIAGKTHYGWARLNESCAKNGENTALLTGYAYET